MNSCSTDKLFYHDPMMLTAKAKVRMIEGDLVILDRTIFYPQGGGQVGDTGRIGGMEVIDTQKRGGRLVIERNLPMVNVECEIVHRVAGDTRGILKAGDEVDLAVDPSHRTGCMRLHGATHLVMAAIWQAFGRNAFLTKGCLIGPTEARLDLMMTAGRFDAGLVAQFQRGINDWIKNGATVEMQPIPGIPEMFIWACDLGSSFASMPCGGTHFGNISSIGQVQLQRRSKGKGLERIYIRVV